MISYPMFLYAKMYFDFFSIALFELTVHYHNSAMVDYKKLHM